MSATELFIGIMVILLIFNWLYISANPSVTNNMIIGAITTLISSALVLSILAGIKFFGTGLSGTSVKTIFGISALLQILFSINFTIGGYNFGIGLGLINNVFNAFAYGDFWGIGIFISTILGIVALVSGLIIIIGSGGES